MELVLAASYLKQLEAESINIFREVAAEAKSPVMLYSVGKDCVMLRLAMKAFYPAKHSPCYMWIQPGSSGRRSPFVIASPNKRAWS